MGRLDQPKVVVLGFVQAPIKVTPTAPVQRLRSASILRRLQTPTALSISQENAGSALAQNRDAARENRMVRNVYGSAHDDEIAERLTKAFENEKKKPKTKAKPAAKKKGKK